MGIILKTLFISIALCVLFEESHGGRYLKIFQEIAGPILGKTKDITPAYEALFKGIKVKNFDDFIETCGIHIPKDNAKFYSGDEKIMIDLHAKGVTGSIFDIPAFRVMTSLMNDEAFWAKLKSNQFDSSVLTEQISRDFAKGAEGMAMVFFTNKFEEAFYAETIFATVEVPNLNKVTDLVVVVVDVENDGRYIMEKDPSLQKFKDYVENVHSDLEVHFFLFDGKNGDSLLDFTNKIKTNTKWPEQIYL